jgi:cation:H+ antiporter
MLISAAAVLVGLLLLFWGADRLVVGAGATARNLGVPPILIGLVIVGFATSAPEMLISAVASMDNAPALAVGNALGSNIANLGLVLGTAILICPIAVQSETLRREFPAVLAATVLTLLLFLDNQVSRFDSVVLLLALGLLTVWIVVVGSRASISDPIHAESEAEFWEDISTGKATFWLVIGLVTLLGGAELMVNGGIDVARRMGISELVVGVTVVAIGTSLPELAVAIAGSLKAESDLVIGNVLGSNIFNLLAVIGIAGAIRPHDFDDGVLTLHFALMSILTLGVFLLAYNRRSRVQLTRSTGGVLLATFLIYQVFVLWESLS